ncbi:hypothetical protein D3C74_281340 [compost metagenome]
MMHIKQQDVSLLPYLNQFCSQQWGLIQFKRLNKGLHVLLNLCFFHLSHFHIPAHLLMNPLNHFSIHPFKGCPQGFMLLDDSLKRCFQTFSVQLPFDQ